ncbi:uncharacterized protein YkvS [Chitinophaga terrae (ex Kim and Jung 2007)]|uniref:DUF6843 domain-containing protein n=1 Tax=Chitinophaga terrae (ex Kim and Jung 2007) TaxID=408074 RepID=UPI002789F5CA|nr:hypothetical protein [Chitinophaga terrae (ex Kim and Jung 2007)]MDQ0110241.1 uncharacterized protein YkvS [Chitinophaga terrae (ex Kim and Jung 2007)]
MNNISYLRNVAIIFILFMGLQSCSKKIEREVFIFPKGFKGNAVILFDQKDGREEKVTNNSVIYDFPITGILLMRSKPHITNMHLSKYYYKDTQEVLRELCSKASKGADLNCEATILNDYFASYGDIEYGVIAIGDTLESFDVKAVIDSVVNLRR